MADPFSIIALVGTTLKGVLKAKDLVDTIQRAPRSIETLGNELSAIAGLLRELGHLTEGSDELNMNRIVREPLSNCENVSKQIEKLVQPYVKTSGGITKWGRFAFGFKESDVVHLQRDMSACKQNLTLAVTSADLMTTRKVVRGMRRVQNHLGIASSSAAPSSSAPSDRKEWDHMVHERIQEWMVDTETIVEVAEPSYTADGGTQQNEPSMSVGRQGEASIEAQALSQLMRPNSMSTIRDNTETYPNAADEHKGQLRKATTYPKETPQPVPKGKNWPVQLTIRSPTGRAFSLVVRWRDTISRLKLRVREETKVPIAEQRLYWEGTLLDSNEKTLSYYDNPRNGKVLYLIIRTGDQEEDSKKMMLHIRDSMSCRIFTLDFRREDKFVDVEQKIKDVEGLATWRQLKLADDRSSLDYCGSSPFEWGLRDGDTIYLDRGFAQPMGSKLNTLTNPKVERNTQDCLRLFSGHLGGRTWFHFAVDYSKAVSESCKTQRPFPDYGE